MEKLDLQVQSEKLILMIKFMKQNTNLDLEIIERLHNLEFMMEILLTTSENIMELKN